MIGLWQVGFRGHEDMALAWLLGKINIVTADVMVWLLTAIALLGGLYMLFM